MPPGESSLGCLVVIGSGGILEIEVEMFFI